LPLAKRGTGVSSLRAAAKTRANYIGERRQDCGASADIIGERGQRQIHVLARIGFTLAVERLVKREFSIKDHSGASTGRLVLKTSIPFATNPIGASIASDGECLVFGSGNNVSSYRFPALTVVNTVSVAGPIDDMEIGKPGPNRYVAAALPFNNAIAVIPLSPTTCALGTPTSIRTAAASLGAISTGADFSPRNDILYVGDANFGRTIVEAFAFPAGTPLTGSPYVYSSGANSNTVLASKDGQCLFVANQQSAGVSSISLSSGIPGATATLFPAGFPGTSSAGMANDITGKRFYLASGPSFAGAPAVSAVTTEIIGSGCALTESPGGPAGTGVPGGSLESLTAFP
jgi:hypothetical protein